MDTSRVTMAVVTGDPVQQAAAGKAARRDLSRSRQAELGDSPRDPLEILAGQDESRVAELVPIRYGRMLASPFAFFRGAAAVMAADLAQTPTTGLGAQLCGDAHLSNFGVFSAPDRRLVFDCNDFDETCPGPFEWDVKRLVASIAVAGRERGFGGGQRAKAIARAAATYRASMRRFAGMRNIDVWYSRIDVDSRLAELRSQVDGRRLREVERNLEKARSKDSLRALRKLTREVDGEVRIVSDPPLITPLEELTDAADAEQQLQGLLATYLESLGPDRRRLVSSYRYVHAARKVVGVGSVGTRAWIVLLLGRDSSDPLFLQAKEAQRSVLEPYAGASAYRNHGRRVVEGQRLMQAAGDVFLGWLAAEGIDGATRNFYVRQLWDGKGSADVERLSPRELGVYAALCGEALARAHARSGERIAIAAYLGSREAFDRAMVEFAEAYADQNERDYARLVDAAANGEVEARL
ncbi:MAG TPA: DUF2252 domain-containing protein [Solirubrobacterales bacterium]|nr:DUF2252 domain-containing protein [Solirubrobacterales bacterium]